MLTPNRILETSLCVDDLEAAEPFYSGVLGLELLAKEPGRHLFYRLAGEMLLLFDPRSTRTRLEGAPLAELPLHGTVGAGHVAFAATDAELELWRAQLAAHGVAIEHEHRWENGALSLYFRDPAGNSLEFVTPSLWGFGS